MLKINPGAEYARFGLVQSSGEYTVLQSEYGAATLFTGLPYGVLLLTRWGASLMLIAPIRVNFNASRAPSSVLKLKK